MRVGFVAGFQLFHFNDDDLGRQGAETSQDVIGLWLAGWLPLSRGSLLVWRIAQQLACGVSWRRN
jgi:hypothetical protein